MVPASEWKTYLNLLHQGHLGIQKCRDRSRQSVYWRGITHDIQVLVSSCSACATYSNSQQTEHLKCHEVPELPWNKLAIRLQSYLVVVDCHSHFPELRRFKGKSAADVIVALKSMFAIHGVPLSILADNMPFGSQMFHLTAKLSAAE